MRRLAVSVLILAWVLAAAPAGADEPEPLFTVQRLSDRVLIFTENSPWESNHVVIVGADGMVLVDPGYSPLMARLIRQAVAAELGRNQFAYVIDTHGHWGHTWGNAGFPEAVVVGHEQAARTIAADRANLEPRLAFLEGRLEQGKTSADDTDPGSAEAHEAAVQLAHFERLAAGLSEPGIAIEPPRLTFSDRLQLDLGDLSLQMVFLGRAHSQSDIAVLIPEEKVLLMGCFFLEQGPLPVFGGPGKLDPDRWLEVFDALLESEPAFTTVVLGQHSVWPRAKLVAIRDYMAHLWSGIQALEAEGVDLDTAITRLPPGDDLDFLREAGVSDEELADYNRSEAEMLWRQLKEPASAMVAATIDDGGAAAGKALYQKLVASDTSDVYFDEVGLNILGYRYLGEGRVDDAIAVFEINVDQFPDSWNVYDSLGEAYAAKGDIARAIELYSRSVEINPGNGNGVQALERLQATTGE
jgi:glyoxylase-like metal-dependent hydrolase (beta-lactamase superfamily II)